MIKFATSSDINKIGEVILHFCMVVYKLCYATRSGVWSLKRNDLSQVAGTRVADTKRARRWSRPSPACSAGAVTVR